MVAKMWAGILAGVMVLGLWGVDGRAADKADQGPASPEQNWQIGLTPSYSSGKFGTNTTSSFFYAPLSIRRLFRDGDVTLVIPFVTATTDGRTTLVSGNATRIDDNGGNSGPGGGGAEATTTAGAAARGPACRGRIECAG